MRGFKSSPKSKQTEELARVFVYKSRPHAVAHVMVRCTTRLLEVREEHFRLDDDRDWIVLDDGRVLSR